MYFQHSSEIWRDFPELVPGVLAVQGIVNDKPVDPNVAKFNKVATSRLAGSSESELPEIQAWRRAFSRMGLKPTQHRCASESLLRRFKKEQSLPSINSLIDLCNSMSLAFAIPIAVFDTSKVAEYITVRYADGNETYLTFANDVEQPEPHEVIFADGSGRAHARRWTNRQSGYSAVQPDTSSVLIVAEAMHPTAQTDVRELISTVTEQIFDVWSLPAQSTILTHLTPRFDF